MLGEIPTIYTIPGQHELPYHQIEKIKESAYWTLSLARAIKSIHRPDSKYMIRKDTALVGFPFGKPLQKVTIPGDVKIALVHDYVWIPGHSYPNAPKSQYLKKSKRDKWHGYDVVVFGDNHKGFLTKRGSTTIFNCGALMRRKSDEIDYKPMVGLLFSDGSVKPHYLDISEDKHLSVEEAKEKERREEEFDMAEFAAELAKLGDSALDFEAAIEEFCKVNKVMAQVLMKIRKAMGNE
jgi:DNA repair exonuclease SbcCD nuclease subunit